MVKVEVLITEIVLAPRFATYTLLPSGVTTSVLGIEMTLMDAITEWVAVLITDTLLLQ